MALVRLLVSRVAQIAGEFVSQPARMIIQLDDTEAERLIAADQAALVDGEQLDLPEKTVVPDAETPPPSVPPIGTPFPYPAPVVAPPSGDSIDVLELNEKIVEALTSAGIETIGQLDAVEDLTAIEGIGRVTAEKIITARRKLANGPAAQGND